MVCWQSINQVNFVDGSVDYACINFAHDDNFSTYRIGQEVKQGDIIAHTGTAGDTTGDHCHLCIGKGTFKNFHVPSSGDGWELVNAIHPYDGMGVNDTDLQVTLGYPWKYFEETPTPDEDDSWIPLSSCKSMWANNV